jgi:hypothetical protein
MVAPVCWRNECHITQLERENGVLAKGIMPSFKCSLMLGANEIPVSCGAPASVRVWRVAHFILSPIFSLCQLEFFLTCTTLSLPSWPYNTCSYGEVGRR